MEEPPNWSWKANSPSKRKKTQFGSRMPLPQSVAPTPKRVIDIKKNEISSPPQTGRYNRLPSSRLERLKVEVGSHSPPPTLALGLRIGRTSWINRWDRSLPADQNLGQKCRHFFSLASSDGSLFFGRRRFIRSRGRVAVLRFRRGSSVVVGWPSTTLHRVNTAYQS